MCYSTANRKKREQIEIEYHAKMIEPLEYEPYYHLNGFTYGNLHIIPMDEPEGIYPASWGLVADWGINDIPAFRKRYNTLNAKSETLLTSNMYKDAARKRRCLVLADGFFEPHHENGLAIPYFCHIPSEKYENGSDLFVFAGIYNEIDEGVYTATILTTEANEFFAEVHNKRKRMPLILDEFFIEDWLDDLNDQQLNELMSVSFTTKEFEAYPVSRDFYKKGIDTNKPYIVERADRDTLF
ncbi:MAG: SOS response-associated peptidase [Aureisphaera sp.]